MDAYVDLACGIIIGIGLTIIGYMVRELTR